MQHPLLTRLVTSDALVVINGADIEQIQQDTNEIGVATVIMATPDPMTGKKVGYKVKMDSTEITAYHATCYERS